MFDLVLLQGCVFDRVLLQGCVYDLVLLQGCVFDLPSELDATIAECWTDTASDSLVKATEMPDLVEHAPGGSGGRGRGGRGRFGGFGGRFNSSGGVANSSNKKTFFR